MTYIRSFIHVSSTLSPHQATLPPPINITYYHIHYPQFPIAHSPPSSLESTFHIKCFTENAFSNISDISLIGNPMTHFSPLPIWPLCNIQWAFLSLNYLFLLCPLLLLSLFPCTPFSSRLSNVNSKMSSTGLFSFPCTPLSVQSYLFLLGLTIITLTH